jgi:hypothetical protein
MSMKWPGGLIRKTPVTPAGPYQNGAAPGMWSLAEASYWTKQGLWPIAGNAIPTDPFFPYVPLLLPGNGTNGAQNNTFLDSSANNFTITRNGNTTQGSFSAYGDLWSNYFDGNGDFLQTPQSAALAANSTNYTVEGWFYFDAATYSAFDSAGRGIVSDFLANANGRWIVGINSSGNLGFYEQDASGANDVSAIDPTPITTRQWIYFAAVKSGTTMRLFKNGTQVATATSAVRTAFSGRLNIGQTTVDTSYRGFFLGNISNVRFVNGSALYSSNFTPPTAPLTAISNTALLTCQSSMVIDNSTNRFVLTQNGNVSVSRFAPFNPTAPYSAATIGGSGYFDGTGDFLTTSGDVATGTGNYTIETYVYMLSLPTFSMFLGKSGAFNTSTYLAIRPNAVSMGTFNGNYPEWSFTFAVNTWYHIAVVRNGGVIRCYVNGVEATLTQFSASDTTSYVANIIGKYGASPDYAFPGYMSGLRIVAGTAIYTSNFTPPTTPPTAVSGTQLLCNFTNAGIVDSAAKTNLETVGNAQISTAQSKFGGSSMLFDGTADALAGYNNQTLILSSRNFTWECWVYLNSISGTQAILSQRGAQQNELFLGLDTASGGQIFAYADGAGSPGRMCSVSMPTGQWVHIALVRVGTTVTLYKNGVGGTTATSSQNFISQNVFVGADDSAGSGTLNGYINDVRITNGVARYTSNFTPPTAAFPTA